MSEGGPDAMPEVGEAVRDASARAHASAPSDADGAGGGTGGVQDVVRGRVPRVAPASRPTFSRRRRRVIGAGATLLLAGALGVAVAGAGQTTEHELTATPRLYVTTRGADVSLESTEQAGFDVDTRSRRGSDCELRPTSTTNATFLRVTCEAGPLSSPDVTIRVPASTQVTLDAGGGDVDVTGTISSFDVRTDDDIELHEAAGDARLRAGGDVQGELAASERLAVTSGDDVELDVRRAPATSRVEARDDVDLRLPDGSYRTHVDTGGDVDDELPHAQSGALVDVVSRDGGDVDLRTG